MGRSSRVHNYDRIFSASMANSGESFEKEADENSHPDRDMGGRNSRHKLLHHPIRYRRFGPYKGFTVTCRCFVELSFSSLLTGRRNPEHEGLTGFMEPRVVPTKEQKKPETPTENFEDVRLQDVMYRWKFNQQVDDWKSYEDEIVFEREESGVYTLEIVDRHKINDSETEKKDLLRVNTLSREFHGVPKDKERPEKLLKETAQLNELFEGKFEFFFLGSGTFGSVYLAAPHPGLGLERFAVKIATDYKGRSALKKERKVMSELLKQELDVNVSHTVTYLSTRELTEGSDISLKDYLFLPYADMGTLKGFADSRIKVGRHTALDLTLQMILGALELKRAGYVHHDIKLANALMYRTNFGPLLKLVDFGSASEAGKSCKMGTPHYTAPEVYRKEKIHIEPQNVTKTRSEIRAMGFSRSKVHSRYQIKGSTIEIHIRSHTEIYKELKDSLNGLKKDRPQLKSAKWKCVRKCDPIPTNEKLDVYSIGTVFFALLTGERFRPRNPKKKHSYIELTVEDRIDMLDGEPKETAKEFFPLLDMMLAIDPKTRYSLEESGEKIRSLLETAPPPRPEGIQLTVNPPGGIFAPGTEPVRIKLWYPSDDI